MMRSSTEASVLMVRWRVLYPSRARLQGKRASSRWMLVCWRWLGMDPGSNDWTQIAITNLTLIGSLLSHPLPASHLAVWYAEKRNPAREGCTVQVLGRMRGEGRWAGAGVGRARWTTGPIPDAVG